MLFYANVQSLGLSTALSIILLVVLSIERKTMGQSNLASHFSAIGLHEKAALKRLGLQPPQDRYNR